MAATDRTALLDITQKEYEKLRKLIAPLNPGFAMIKDSENTSIKDVIVHRAHWIDLFLGWYADGMAGKEVHFPAKRYKWNELKAYNAALRERQKDMEWDEALAALDARQQALMRFVQDHSEAELYGGPMQGAKNDWTPGRWAEAAGPSHFRSAAKYVRGRLKEIA